MEFYFGDEIYAEDSDSYMEYFSKNIENRGSKTDKKSNDMIAKYDINADELSN